MYMGLTKTQAIAALLGQRGRPDLAALYHAGMEVQVNVAADGGEQARGEYNGRTWRGYTDGLTTWKPFRIPRNAKTTPEYTDSEMKWDIAAHADGIGMTGWNWQDRCSVFCGFDFDSISNHAEGLTAEQMQDVHDRVSAIEWVTVRRSTSGSGLHIYVMLPNVPTANHDEHAALSRAVLGQLSAATCTTLEASVDCVGGNMWVWHRKTGSGDGLTCIKQGRQMRVDEVPANWRDHISVVTNKRRRVLPQVVEDAGESDWFEDLVNQRPFQKLTPDHQILLDWLRANNALWWWISDTNMLVTHTKWLKMAHRELALKGCFETNSAGTNMDEQNCFCFPLRKGAWAVRRFSRGIAEATTWEQDPSGWTKCLFNAEPTVEQALKAAGALEDAKGNFHMSYLADARTVFDRIGRPIPEEKLLEGRSVGIKQLKSTNKLAVEIPADKKDTILDGWLRKDKGDVLKGEVWQRIVSLPTLGDTAQEDFDADDFDKFVRHLVTPDKREYGWAVALNGAWHYESVGSIKLVLKAQDFSAKEIDIILGKCIQKCWTIVQRPFENEYPGGREWNLNAAQLKYTPTTDKDQEALYYPTWSKILDHAGCGLTSAVLEDKWCKINNIKAGGEYLKLWVASMFKEPDQPLPYLFLYGEQNTGKSALHMALTLLLTRGSVDASASLLSSHGFNKELEGAVLCTIEEINLNKNAQAYNRIKDWTTSERILIHEKCQTPYQVPNTTHWIQCANDVDFLPVFTGDTRIVMINVPPLDITEMIPRKELNTLLQKEAPDFLAMLLHVELPKSGDRLNLPVVASLEKMMAAELNEPLAEKFVKEHLTKEDGYMVKFSDLFSLLQTLNPGDNGRTSTKALASALIRAGYQKGRDSKQQGNPFCIVNAKCSSIQTERAPHKWDVRGMYVYPGGQLDA